MRRAKAFLVFGRHGNHETGSPSNQVFFRNAIGPILEDIGKHDKKGVIVHEAVSGLPSDLRTLQDLKECLNPDCIAEMNESVRDISPRIRQELETTLDIGEPSSNISPWGFEPVLCSINKKNSGRIINLVEPQATYLVLSSWFSYLIHEARTEVGDAKDLLELARRILIAEVHEVFLRDCALTKMMIDLAIEDSERVIIVPRGTSHIRLFDHLKCYHADLFDTHLFFDETKANAIEHQLQILISRAYQAQFSLSGPSYEALETRSLELLRNIIEQGGTGLISKEVLEECAFKAALAAIEQSKGQTST